MSDGAAKWRRLGELSAWQWRVLLLAPWILAMTGLRLRFGGYAKTLAVARPRRSDGLAPEQHLALAREAAYALAVAGKYGPWRPECLVRSLALGWFLGRRGIPFEVRLGVPRGAPCPHIAPKLGFTAHAWVEHGGVVLNDRPDIATRFQPFNTHSGPA